MKPSQLREYSFLTWGLERLFRLLQLLSVATWVLGSRVSAQTQFSPSADPEATTKKRGRRIELYVLAWLLVEAGLLVFIARIPREFGALPAFVAGYRVLDILQATLNFNIFDRLRISSKVIFVSSLARTAILSVWNFFESILCFAIIYASNHELLQHGSGPIDASESLYFSTVTQLTIGYGDILPTGWLRWVVMAQGACGFLLGVFAVSRVISFLPKTESVIGDE